MLDNNKEPEVLVAVLSYNQGKYIRQCLDSILMQQCNFSFRIFIFDDVSTDNSWDIILKYKNIYNDKIIAVRPEQNQFSLGIYNSFSKRIFALREYKYIALLEADDYWSSSEKLQKQYDSMEKNVSCSLCVCATDSFDDIHQKMMGGPLSDKNEIISGEKIIIDTLKWNCLFGANTYFIRNDCFASVNMELKYWNYVAGDMTISLYLATQGDILYLGECMAVKRKFNNGSLSEKSYQKQEGVIPFWQDFEEDIQWALSISDITSKYEDAVYRYILWRKIRTHYINSGQGALNKYVSNSNGKLYKTELARKMNRIYIRIVKLLYGNNEVKFVKRERLWMEREWKRLQKKELRWNVSRQICVEEIMKKY